MIEQIKARIEVLEQEFATGQERLQQLEAERIRVTETMIRIKGARQVLNELLIDADEAQHKE